MRKLFTLGVLLLSAALSKAQTYADQLVASGPCTPIVALVCPSGVENPGNLVDASKENYALMKTNLGLSLIQSTAFIEVGFSKKGAPGSEIAVVIEKLDQSLNIDLVDNLTVIVYDTLGNEVVRRSDLSLQDVGALGGSSSKQLLRVSTPLQNYAIGKVRIELAAVANVLQSLAVYSVSHNESCPPVAGTSILRAVNCTNPNSAIDGDTATFATFSLPLSLGQSARLNVGYTNSPMKGDYVGFEIAKGNTLLQLGLIDNLNIICRDVDGNELFKKSDFSTADLIALDQLGGLLGPLLGQGGSTNQRFIIGTIIPSTVTIPIASVELELNSTIGLLLDLRIYNAFYYSQLNGIRITADKVGIINGNPVKLTADSGFDNYRWSNGTTGRETTVTTAGTYTVTVSRFDGCELTGSFEVKSLDCGANGRVFADVLEASGNCDPQIPLICPSGVENPQNAVDGDRETFARMSSSLGLSLIESTSFIDVSFTKTGDPGSDIGVVIQPINQNLNADVVDNLTIIVYDENGNEVARRSNVGLEDVGLLSGTGTQAVLTVRTPIGNYRIKRVRVELEGVLNVLQDLSVYGIFYDCACPPIMATSVIGSTNTINPELAIDADNSNFALINLPLALGSTGSLEVGFSQNVAPGDYVGFQIEPDNNLLSLSLIENLEVEVLDEFGVVRDSYADFSLANLVAAEQLGGTLGGLLGAGGAGTAPTVVGFQTDTGDYRINSIRLKVNSTIGLLISLRVYNAFSLTQLFGVRISSTDSVSCEGNPVTLTAPAGFDDYLWSTGATTRSITVNNPGQYSVTISRTDGCSLSGSYFIRSRTFGTEVNKFEPACGQSNGFIAVNPVNGSGNYSYRFSNGATTDSISGLAAGNYSVIITDIDFGCVDTINISLGNSDADFIGYVRHADCGQENGAIFLTLPAGATVLWSNGETTKVIRNLDAGRYEAMVTFANGCIGIQTFTVLDYQNFGLRATVVNANCILDNGAIDLSVDSVGTYTYLWSNDATTQDIFNLRPDYYSVVVTNTVNGCQDFLDTTVSDLGSPVISLVDLKEETCSGSANGRVEINYVPADTAYVVQWNNGASTKAIEYLGPGIYVVKVTNNVGCEGVRHYELVARDSVRISLFTTFSNCEAPFNGEVSSLVTGGRTPYDYQYSTGDTTSSINGVAPGEYSLQIVDANGCVTTASATVERSPACDGGEPDTVRASQLVTPNGDGFNDTWKTTLITDYPSNHVDIFSRDGALVFEKDNYKNEWGGTYRRSNVLLPDGTYFWVFEADGKEFRGFLVIKH
ncbi:MAG: gliding motility-associated C-terminal domain-containing protein [Bacteroidota bacterium]